MWAMYLNNFLSVYFHEFLQMISEFGGVCHDVLPLKKAQQNNCKTKTTLKYTTINIKLNTTRKKCEKKNHLKNHHHLQVIFCILNEHNHHCGWVSLNTQMNWWQSCLLHWEWTVLRTELLCQLVECFVHWIFHGLMANPGMGKIYHDPPSFL